MKAKMEVNSKIIQDAIVAYFKNMSATKAELKSSKNWDMYGAEISPSIYAEVEIDVGEPIAQ